MKQQKPNRRDVALLAGVSEATVSYVFNNKKKVSFGVCEKVKNAARQLGYTPNLVAKSLATSSTHHVALLVDNLKNPHFCELLEGAQAVASQNGYIVSVIAADTSNQSSIAELVGRGVDGIINSLRCIDIQKIIGAQIPSVCEGVQLKRDYFFAINKAVSVLKSYGHKDIAFLSGVPLNLPDYGRLQALKRAIVQNGLVLQNDLFIENPNGYKTDEAAGAVMADILLARKKKFTAVFAINDLVAIGAAKKFIDCGLCIPEDISVIGCDNLKILDYLPIELSSIDTKSFETGKILMSALIAEINEKPWEPPVFVCDFVNRKSICQAKI